MPRARDLGTAIAVPASVLRPDQRIAAQSAEPRRKISFDAQILREQTLATGGRLLKAFFSDKPLIFTAKSGDWLGPRGMGIG